MYVQGNVISGKCTFRKMYIRDNVVSAKCFSGKCNFWKVFFGEVYRFHCQQATASDLPFYDIFAPQKVSLLKIPDEVIACDLWFAPPNQKSWLRLCTLCPWSLASSILILGLERVCPREVGPWPRFWIFLSSWPRTLGPRLHLCYLT